MLHPARAAGGGRGARSWRHSLQSAVGHLVHAIRTGNLPEGNPEQIAGHRAVPKSPSHRMGTLQPALTHVCARQRPATEDAMSLAGWTWHDEHGKPSAFPPTDEIPAPPGNRVIAGRNHGVRFGEPRVRSRQRTAGCWSPEAAMTDHASRGPAHQAARKTTSPAPASLASPASGARTGPGALQSRGNRPAPLPARKLAVYLASRRRVQGG